MKKKKQTNKQNIFDININEMYKVNDKKKVMIRWL